MCRITTGGNTKGCFHKPYKQNTFFSLELCTELAELCNKLYKCAAVFSYYHCVQTTLNSVTASLTLTKFEGGSGVHTKLPKCGAVFSLDWSFVVNTSVHLLCYYIV